MEILKVKKYYRLSVITLLSLLVVLNLFRSEININITPNKEMSCQELEEIKIDKIEPIIKEEK